MALDPNKPEAQNTEQDFMESLSEEQYDQLYQMVMDPNNAAGARIRDNPEDLAYATAVLEKHSGRIVRNRIRRNIQAGIESPSTVASGFARGVSNTLYQGGLLVMDLLKALSPAGGNAEQELIAGKERIKEAQDAMYAEAKKDNDRYVKALGPVQAGAIHALGYGAGTVAPWLVVPGGMNSLWKTVLWNTGVGATAGAMTKDYANDLVERFGDAKIGALVGLVASPFIHSAQEFRHYAARKLATELEKPHAKANLLLEEKAQKFLGDDFSFDLGQVTANPFIIGLQVGAARAATREFQTGQINRLIDYATWLANRMSSARDPERLVRQWGKTVEKIRSEYNKRMTAKYGDAMENIVRHYGDEVVLDGRQYMRDLQEMQARFSDPRYGHTGAPQILQRQLDDLDPKVYPYEIKVNVIRDKDGKEIRQYYTLNHKKTGELSENTDYAGAYDTREAARQDLDMLNMQEGGLRADDVRALLEGFRVIRGSDVGITGMASAGTQQQLANWMEASFLSAFDDTARNLKPEAIQAIEDARLIYAFEVEQRNGVMNSLLAPLFIESGEIGVRGDPRAALDMLIGPKSTPALRAEVVRTLEAENPELLGSMRSFIISEWLRKATVDTAPASMPKLSPVLLSKQLRGEERWGGEAALGLFDPADQQSFRQFSKVLDTMKETYQYVFPEASGAIIADTSINLISRSPEFFARFMTRVATQSGYMERILHDKAFRDAAVKLANKKARWTPKEQSLMLFLEMRIAEWMAADEREQHERAKEQARQETMEPGGA